MSNKYQKLAEEKAKQAAAAAEAPDTRSVGERIAGAATTALDSVNAAKEGALGNVPFLPEIEASALGMLPGTSTQEQAQYQEKLRREHGTIEAGAAGASAGAAAALTGGASVALGGAAGAAAVGASEAGVLTPFYKMGEAWHQAQLKGDALHIEQIANAFDFHDIMSAAGIAALFHAPAVAGQALAPVGKAAQGLLSKAAASSAGEGLRKSARDLGMEPAVLGRQALDEGWLAKPGEVQKRLKSAGTRMEEAVAGAEVDSVLTDKIGAKLQELDKSASSNAFLAGAREDLQAQIKLLRKSKDWTGEKLQGIANSFGNEVKKARAAKDGERMQFYSDAKEVVKDVLQEHLTVQDPELGAAYRGANNDYKLYSRSVGEAERLALKQASGMDVAKGAAKLGIAHAAGQAVGGTPGAIIADAGAIALGARGLKNKSFANLMDKISKASPSEMFEEKTSAVLQTLLGNHGAGAVYGAQMTSQDQHKNFEQTAKALRSAMADPDGTAQRLRAQVDFMPPQMADALVANTMNKLQAATLDLPPENGPATFQGVVHGVSDRQKYEWLRKTRAKFEPHAAIESGRQDLIQEAEKYNPEMMHEIKGRLINELATRQDLPYMTKRRVSGILGVAGVPSQDPAIGASLQQIIATRKAAQSQVGQMGSARQMNANMKNDSATLTRAQGILNQKEA